MRGLLEQFCQAIAEKSSLNVGRKLTAKDNEQDWTLLNNFEASDSLKMKCYDKIYVKMEL